jgi:hypothetical protein
MDFRKSGVLLGKQTAENSAEYEKKHLSACHLENLYTSGAKPGLFVV